MTNTTKRHFLTVEWCNNGRRGIFCNAQGEAYSKETPHTQDGMSDILGIFALILTPQTTELTELELHEYSYFQPLAEYSHVYGIGLKPPTPPGS